MNAIIHQPRAGTAEPPGALPRAAQAAELAPSTPPTTAADMVEERTWADLEMEQVFQRLDRSATPLGSRHLRALLHQYQPAPAAHQTATAIRLFMAEPSRCSGLRQALQGLTRTDGADAEQILAGPPLAPPAHHRWLYLAAAAAFLCPFGLILSRWFLPVCLMLWVLNLVLHCRHQRDLLQHASAFATLAALLGCVPSVCAALRNSGLPELRQLGELSGVARRSRKRISMTFLERAAGTEVSRILVEYLNLLCLFELCALCRAISTVNQERAALATILRLVGRLDALQGLSRSLQEYPLLCEAELTASRGFTLTEVYHPLLEQPVPNTINVAARSLLFTGTNMAGKTTFIKTLAINLLLAQTLGFCLARRAVLPPARLQSLINRADQLLAGQSYFFAEAAELLRQLQQAQGAGREVWFVLDEVFRGTNSVERIAAAGAVLDYLAQAGLVLASTHDQELTTLLATRFEVYHFSEQVDGPQVRFDYRLKPGPCTSRNALKLLALAGFPQPVIDRADQLVRAAPGRAAPG